MAAGFLESTVTVLYQVAPVVRDLPAKVTMIAGPNSGGSDQFPEKTISARAASESRGQTALFSEYLNL